jgi:hypothetical protein
MLLELAIKQLLEDAPAVTAIAQFRIYPGIAPQSATHPLIGFRPPSSQNRKIIQSLDGGIALVRETIQIYSSSEGIGKYVEVATLDDQIFRALNEFAGTVTNTTLVPNESLVIQGIFATEQSHVYIGYDDRTQTHHFMSEFHVNYEYATTPVFLPGPGTTPTSGFHDEDLSSQVASGNTIFTLGLIPSPGSLAFYVNGILQWDYVLTGLTVQLNIAPSPGDKVNAHYFA